MDLSRRAVLGAAAAAALAPAVTQFAGAAPAVALDSAAPDWVGLDRAVTGAVYRPGSTGYGTSKLIFNTRYDGATPLAVVRPTNQADIQQTVAFARRYGLRISPRNGGHSYVGASAASGTIVLDLRGMAWAPSFNGSSVQVYAGSTLYPVKAALAARGLAIPTGTCPTVGVAGLTTGGGIGVESRRWGMTCDRVTSMTVVTGTGAALRISDATHPDLFWALRGGGGGSAAIVTSLTFAAHRATSKGTFRLVFPSSAGVAVMTGWARWAQETWLGRWANVHLDALGTGGVQVTVVGSTEAGDERAAAAALVSAIGVRPSSAGYQQLSYLAAVRYFGGGSTSARQPFAAGSEVLPRMNTSVAQALLGTVRARSAAGARGAAIIDPLTGGPTWRGAAATAFPWRSHLATVQWYVGGSNYTSAYRWIGQAHAALAPYSVGGYVNYLEAGTSMGRYLAGNLTRWRSVRTSYDPDGVLAAPIAV